MNNLKRIIAKLLIFVMCFTAVGYGPLSVSAASTSSAQQEAQVIAQNGSEMTDEEKEAAVLALSEEGIANTSTEGETSNDGSRVTVYLSISEDGNFVTGKDAGQTLISHVPITVEYFDLAEYGLEAFYRYESDIPENGGEYIGDSVLEQPTILHLFIRAIETYYLGGEKLEVGGDALTIQGSSTAMFMKRFWGHDENLMYFVNHAYPLMKAGWGATADYILLEEGMEIDVAMFSDWNFYTYGAFAYFTPSFAEVAAGEEITLKMNGVSTMADVNGESREEMPMADEQIVFARVEDTTGGYSNDAWEFFDECTDEEGNATISFDEPGTYLVSSTSLYETFKGDNDTACVAPPIATVVVTGETDEEDTTGTENLTVLSELLFTAQTTKSSSAYAMTPVFDAAANAYTIYVPDTANSIAVWGKSSVEVSDVPAKGRITAEYQDVTGTVQSLTKETDANSGLNLPSLIQRGEGEARLTITASCGLSSQEYHITVKRTPTLAAVSVEDEEENPLSLHQNFSSTETEYSVNVPAGISELRFVTTPTSEEYTLTVDGVSVSETEKYNLVLNEENPQIVEVVVTGTNGQTTTYHFTLNKKVAVKCTIDHLIPGTVVQITDSKGSDIIKDTITDTSIAVQVQEDETYTYKLSLKGYQNKTGSFTAGTSDLHIEGSLTPIEENGDIDKSITSLWPSFRGNQENNAVTDAKTPSTADSAQLLWAVKNGGGWSGAPSSPIFVEDDLVFTTNTEIIKVDRISGEVIQRGSMISKSAFSLTPPTYAEGMIFVSLAGGRVQAFNAKTLESLWVYQDQLGGQPNSPILYHEGYVYTGFWNSEIKKANYVGLIADDENPAELTEEKTASWTHTHEGGFYWAGAIATESAIVVGSENGAEDESVSTGTLYAFHPESGKIIDKMTDIDGDIRSSIVYDTASGKYCFVSRGGSFYSLQILEDGTFARDTLQKVSLGGAATSVPVVYNGRAYVGVAGKSVLGAYSGHSIKVIDLTKNQIAYSVPTRGYPQASSLLTTGYEDCEGYVYVYFIENYTPGIMRVIKDKQGQTAPLLNETNAGILGEREADDYLHYADTLFTPRGEQAEFAIGSPIADEYGTLYFKNDSSYMMALGSKIERIEVTQLPDKTKYEAGETFDPAGMKVVAHLANGLTRDVTDYVSYPTEPLTEYDLEVEITYPHVKYNDQEKKADIPTTYLPVASISTAEIERVQNVISLIDQIKTAENQEAAAETARNAFDDLGTKLQKYVANEDVLIDYELQFAQANILKGSPNGVSLSVKSSGYDALKLTWSKNAYADGYEVYRSTTSGSRGTRIKIINSGSTTTLTNSGLTTGKLYYYTVRPFILVDGEPVGEVYSETVSGKTVIAAPTLKAARKSYNCIKLTWTQVKGATGYQLYRYNTSKKSYVLLKSFTRSTDVSYTDTNLTCGTTYRYKIKSVRNGELSGYSAEASAKPTLSKPTGLKAARAGYNSIKLTWKKTTGATGYKIYRYNAKKKSYALIKTVKSGTTLTYKNTALATGTTYKYKIKAYRGSSLSAYSTVVSAKPTLAKVTNFKVKAGTKKVTLTWKKTTGASGYVIYRAASKNGKYSAVKTIKSGKTVKFVNQKLKKGKTYYYKIKAYRIVNGKKVFSPSFTGPLKAKVK